MNTDEEVHAALQNILSNFGLDTFYPNKLTLQSVLEINKNSTYEKAALSPKDIPFCFLRNLFKINAECRSSTQILADNEENYDLFDVALSTVDSLDKKVHFLDLMVALLLCADSFLQQEISLKMSMCQFSVPLLLPCSNNSQCKLMLWALRDIVKEWCPHDLSESKGFAENSIVQTNMVFYSFVRLKKSSLSKSQVLNLILSRGQQNHNIFIHSGMEGGRIKRKISNGLVEVCWYLPCGRESLDIFPEPVAFANLRGDIYEFHAQFSFLFQVSTAMFVFLDKVEEKEQNILTDLQDVESKLFLIFNRSERSTEEDIMSVKKTIRELNLPTSNIKIKDPSVNEAEFSRKLCSTIKASLLNVENSLSIGDMFSKAAELGLALDESKTDEQKKAAQAIIYGIEEKPIPQYKNQQLPLQGENWKRLSELERLGCRMNKSLESGLEDNICKIEEDKEKVRNELCKYKLTKGMGAFIENVSTNDKEKRKVFLKWMKLKLDAYSRKKLCGLRNILKDKSKPKDIKLIAELDQALLKNSLGIEHYVREMGLIYEVSLYSKEITEKISNLPSLAAEMLLDGYPLELLDGEASNISERWVKDVLMEVHKKALGKSRLLVLTVLGVQSSGKSTLLNTMFGVQFPVSSGRCTRGAYMIFLKVGEDIKNDLNYDFIVLIDTEGLKSPDLAQLEDSYEHDNQLATFVIGLSDVTIINIAMENSTEMKDVLQITAHAFLRMNEIGKKTVCHFVHQNVGGVSAHSKCMAERKNLLDQLNEMTQLAAEMEKRPSIKAFTDVLDYDIEKNNWNIPGLWHGTPPMAPVNTGYSEAVADLKKNLLETMKNTKHDKASEIPDFLEWIESMWRAVKYENFIFSFRNTLVAHAYDNLCKEFSQWEWEFKRKILTWQTEAEYQILNADNYFDVGTWNQLVAAKKSEATQKIKDESKLIKKKLHDYYERKDRQISLIEKYKVDFINSITNFEKELQQSVNTKLDCTLELTISTKKAEEIKRKYRGVIEKQVMKLLSDCKNNTLSDDQLTQEFEKMWINATVNVHGLKEEDIAGFVLKELRNNFSNLNVNKILQKIDLKKYGTSTFEIKSSHVDSLWEKFKSIIWMGNIKPFTDNVIACCTQFINEATMSNGNYHDSFTRDLLKKVDGFLEQSCKNYRTNYTFEIDLKLHICGFAAREFQKMHKQFLHRNSPLTQLEKYKNKYLSDFLDSYKKRDHCQRKANDFAKFCIKPAVDDYINRKLGVDIVDEILASCYSAEYSSRSYFQYNLLKDLLLKDDFRSFLKYISNYEIYVKDWIFQHILKKMQEDKTLCKLKNNILEVIFKKILDAFNKASKPHGNLLADDNKNITEFISNMRQYLNKDISFSVEDEKTILFQIQSTCHPFINSLKISIEDLKGNLQENYSKSEDITETLSKLPIKPQDELFNRVFGCGEQCPFCKVPCEAGGKEHKQHHAAVHRPQGLARFTHEKNTKLVETLCTTDVQSECTFRNTATKWEWHPYKQYTTIYPEWYIPPDRTIEASEYWKYVMVQFNNRFAEEYNAEQADLPQAWKKITKAQALKGLKEAFSIK